MAPSIIAHNDNDVNNNKIVCDKGVETVQFINGVGYCYSFNALDR